MPAISALLPLALVVLQVRSDLDTMLLPLLELLYSAHERTPNQARH